MPNWYEVFDNEQVQGYIRRQATRLSVVATVVVLLSLFAAALGLAGHVPLPVVGSFFIMLWFGTVRWMSNRMRKLRQIVWCIKLSPNRLIGYDYTRQKTELRWSHVKGIELTQTSLLIIGPELVRIEVPHLFPDFHKLSHRVVFYAELHEVPILIEGQPWESIDVYDLFPFLANGTSADS